MYKVYIGLKENYTRYIIIEQQYTVAACVLTLEGQVWHFWQWTFSADTYLWQTGQSLKKTKYSYTYITASKTVYYYRSYMVTEKALCQKVQKPVM